MKGTRLINGFSEKILIWANGTFWAQKWIRCKNFFKILHNERCQYVDESNINNFFQKEKKFGANEAILGPKIAHPHNSGSALRIFLKFCTMKMANK